LQRRTFLAATTALAVTAVVNPAFAQAPNPLLAPWTGPYGGVPAFDRVKVEDFKPALEAAMAENLAEIEAIASQRTVPTFENTIAAMENSGRRLSDLFTYYGVWGSNLSTPEFQAVETEMDPKISAFFDQITQNEALFRRIEAVNNSVDKPSLTPEQQRLTWLTYTNFVRAGARLDAPAKARIAQINQRLASLFTSFNQNLLHDEEAYVLYLKKADLKGLPQSVIDGAAQAAEEKGRKGEYAILNTRSSMEPFLTYSDRRDLREKVWTTYYARGDNADQWDNNKIITEILSLRAERAKLLGYPTHAHWRLENAMAKTPERAMELMEAVWTPAVAAVKTDVAMMQKIADAQGGKFKIAPWDYRYYMEKVRKEQYDLDLNEVKPYLQLEKLREGMFWAAGEVYGFSFRPVTGLPVFHPDVRVWEVLGADGRHVGLWYFDPYARQGKRSGAWMNAYRTQENFLKPVTTIVSNNSNFVKGKPGEPVLISWDDADTMFHEFGHALHGLSSKASYPSLSGTAVPRDYVEFPSQLNEHWFPTPQVLSRFATHYKTGEPIPQALVDKIEKTETFNQGFSTVEYLGSALIDMKLHLAGDTPIDPDAFERVELARLGMPPEIVMRHRTPQFGHVFSSDGYSAGYYSYLWSDTLTADVAEAFEASPGGFYDKATSARLIETIMSKGNSVDPADQFRAFRGRDPDIGALMRKRGFPYAG
jgi:peptidyl-dipeptidase Dcp